MVDLDKTMTPAERALRVLELTELVAPLAIELTEHQNWMKANIPAGSYPGDGFHVKRWQQNGALDVLRVGEDYPQSERPELWKKEPILSKMVDALPADSYPELYVDEVDPDAVKTEFTDNEKKVYFKQVPYLKVTSVAKEE